MVRNPWYAQGLAFDFYDTLGKVMQRADEALYRAKANGRDRVETSSGCEAN